MQSILFIQKKLDDQDVIRIEEALSETRVEFRVRKNDSLVIVEGRNDIVHTAKVALREAGYIVE